MKPRDSENRSTDWSPRGEWPFWAALGLIVALYVGLLLAMLLADAQYMFGTAAIDSGQAGNPILAALANENIQYSLHLTLVTCTITSLLSLGFATPIGYVMSRRQFWGKHLVDTLLDIPIVLPPLVIGLSLLILFQFADERIRELVVYQVPAVVLAQFVVASAFAIRTMKTTFDQIDVRREQVAMTLGASRLQVLGWVVLPEARQGMLTAALLAWARAMGEFGPLLVFAGATRGKTEVLSTTVFLELSVGDLRSAVAVSLIMIIAAVSVLTLARYLGRQKL